MKSAQALSVILTVFLAIISQCHISVAQGIVTQTGRETIESYHNTDDNKEFLTISVEYHYQWPPELSSRSFSAPPGLIGEVSFSSTGAGACTRVNTRTIRCPSFTTSFRMSYRYQDQVYATEGEKETFNYRSAWGFHGRTANTTLDLFYPPSLIVCRNGPLCNPPNPEPTVDESGHLRWVEENAYSRFLADVRLQVRPPCPPGLSLITDPDAKAFEEGRTINTVRLTSKMQTALACLREKVEEADGAFTLTSAYRPPQYQKHLREVWDSWMELRNNLELICNDLRESVRLEFNKHGLLLTQRPASPNGPHTMGQAFDAVINLPAGEDVDILADQCELIRPLPQTDPVHFVHQ